LALLGLPGRFIWIVAGNKVFPPSHPECPFSAAQAAQGARWCRTLAGFDIACLNDNDIVCHDICLWGYWEFSSVTHLGLSKLPVGDVIDIGANMGWYTLLFAHAGFAVHAFEAMPHNVALINASLCANPALSPRVTVHPLALAAKPGGDCEIYSSIRNVGDGTMCCAEVPCDVRGNSFYELRNRVKTTTLDAELLGRLHGPIAFMKIDVEGYECEVLEGASRLFARNAPFNLMSEIWQDEAGCTPAAYMAFLRKFGYRISVGRDHSFFDLTASGDPTGEDDLTTEAGAARMFRHESIRNIFAIRA